MLPPHFGMDSDDLRRIGRGLLRALANPRRGGSVQMKLQTRSILFGLIAIVSTTSGCACCDNPCWGFRLHPFHSSCGSCNSCGCCPAYSSPVSAPVVYRPPTIATGAPDCPSCGGGGVVMHQPPIYPAPSGFPVTGYPPIIGNPMPLPGTPSFPGHDTIVPNPMPPAGGK